MNDQPVPTLWTSLAAVSAIAAFVCGLIAFVISSGAPWYRLRYAVPCAALVFAAMLYLTHQTFSVEDGYFVYASLLRSDRIPVEAITKVSFYPSDAARPGTTIVLAMKPVQAPDGTLIGRGAVYNLGNWAWWFPDGASWAKTINDLVSR